MKRWYPFVYFFLFSLLLNGQNNFDGIRELLPNYPDSAYVEAKEWNVILLENQTDSLLGQSYYLLGLSSYYKSDYFLAIDYFEKSIANLDSTSNLSYIEASYNNIGICKEMTGDLSGALEAYLKSQEIARIRSDSVGVMQTNINIGLLNIKINRIELGKTILKETASFFDRLNDSVNLALIFQNFAKAADLEGDLDSFVIYSNQALEIYRFYDYRPGICEILNNLGNAYIKVGDYRLAKLKLNEALVLANNNGLKNSEGFILLNLGKLAYQENRLNDAVAFYTNSYSILDDVGNIDAKEGVLWDLFELYFKLNNYELFSATGQQLRELIQVDKDKNSTSRIDQLNQIYELEKKEQIINYQRIRLNFETKLNLGLIAFILFGGFFVYILYQQKIKENKQLKSLYKINRELVGSIPDIQKNEYSRDEKLSALYQSLLDMMEQQDIYKDSDLDLKKLTQLLNTNETYLSEAINKIGGQNLNQLLNTYRVRAIQKEIHSMDLSNISLKELSLKYGFNARSTFYRAFKNEVGMSPQQYIEFTQQKGS